MPNTQWSEVELAAQPANPLNLQALESLLGRYRGVVLSHLCGKFEVPLQEAEDIFHSFVEKRILESDFLAGAEPDQGRFRNYLLSAIDRFAISAYRHRHARKRSADASVPLDQVPEDKLPMAHSDYADEADIDWPQAALAGALLNMLNDCVRKGAETAWRVFTGRVLGPEFDGLETLSYDDLVRQLNLGSPAEAFNLTNTAKRMFRRHLSRVVDQYSLEGPEVREQLAGLRTQLDRDGRHR
jgi:DNA-directed RNA polymerase specialized sigma24 family protein